MKGKHSLKTKLNKKVIVFLLIYFMFFTIYQTVNTSSKYRGISNKSGNIGIAKWDVSTEAQSTNVEVVTGNGETSYKLRVTSTSEVAVKYDVLLSNLPEGVQVTIDGGTSRTPTGGSITFENVGSFTADDENETNEHILTFAAPIDAKISESNIKVNAVFTQWKISQIPEGYTECEYLESTGTQYIDTGVISNNINKINIRFCLTNNANIYGILGGGWTENSSTFQLIYNSNTKLISMRWGTDMLSINYDTNIHNAELSKNKLSIDEETINNNSTINDNRSVYLFARRLNNNGAIGIQEYSFCRIYACKIYDREKIASNFIPALDINRTPCLYDTVTKQTFYNQGTGTFLYKIK